MRSVTESQDRVPNIQKIAYGLGSLTNNLLGGAIGSMAIVLNLGLGMNPATIGSIMGISRLTDAFIDPVMGYVSDHTSSRWGRRRPFLAGGSSFGSICGTSLGRNAQPSLG